MARNGATIRNKLPAARKAIRSKRWPSVKNFFLRVKQAQAVQKEPTEWKSFKVRKTALVSLFVVTILLIGGIVALVVLSSVNHGFVRVKDTSSNFAYIDWKISLTWIVVPSIIFQAYGLGAAAEKSIALDYASFFPVQREWKAFRNDHWHVGVPFVVSLLLKIVIGPLAARMIIEQPHSSTKPVQLTHDYAFVTTSSVNEPLGWDLEPVLGAASSTKVYGGVYPRWVDGNHTFLSFTYPELPSDNVSQSIVTANTSAVFARLDCQAPGNVDDHIRVDPDPRNPDHAGRFYLNGTDNGCFWRMNFGVTEGFATYLQTDRNTSCGTYGNSGSSGRLIVVGGMIRSMKEYDLTIISCVPTYWNISGELTMDMDANARNQIKSWNENTSTARELRPEWWASFEQQLHQVGSVDTTTNYGNADLANGVGRLILDYARRTSSDPFDTSTLIEASQEVYATVYATLLNTFMIRSTEQPVEVPGKLTRIRSKLFIVNAIAGVILGFLLTVTTILILIYFYTESRPSVLFEEPVGILGYAGLALNGIVCRMTEGVRSLEGYSGKTSKDVLTKIKLVYGPTAAFEMVDSEDPRRAHIEVWPSRNSGKETLLPFMQNGNFRAGSRVHDDHQEPGPENETRAPLTTNARQTSTSASSESIELRRLGATRQAQNAAAAANHDRFV